VAGHKKKKIRTDFRKNRAGRARQTDWTRRFARDGIEEDEVQDRERISGRGELVRRRTVVGREADEGEEPGLGVELDVDESACRPGRVLSVHGLLSHVQHPDGRIYQCATRRLLKTLSTEQRHVVAVGDRVLFRPVEHGETREGIIERVEPRRGSLCRTSRGRQQVIVTNVDQVLIVTSAAEPRLKPNLIDRMLVAAEKMGIRPVVSINKIDLAEPVDLMPLVGVYSQMGYTVLLTSAKTGFGLDRLRALLRDRESVLAGQSGVGKSSLLNAVDPALELPVAEVSRDTQKGKHTTTTARLLPLSFGGYVVDTPGIRQFQLWDVIPEEVAGYYRDLRPYVSRCRFPDCTHTHEAECAVKDAVADGRLDARRYESYCHLAAGEMD
jgi:ribosome biogenesis GTPase